MTEDLSMNTTTYTTERQFVRMDAGQMREFLAEQLAAWRAEGMAPTGFSRVWFRRVAILARRTQQRRAAVILQLSADADAIAAEEA